jgi:hypothetical protein
VRPPKEIVILVILLLCGMASVLWYVLDRRARLLAPATVVATPARAVPASPVGQISTPPAGSAPAALPVKVPASSGDPVAPAVAVSKSTVATPVDLSQQDGKTIDFSTGHPVVKQTAEDKAALDAGLKDIADATKGVTFDPPAKPPEPPPTPAKP